MLRVINAPPIRPGATPGRGPGAACGRHRRLRGGRGFTLLELVLVIFVMALTSSILIPRIGSGWKRMEEREFLQQLVQTLKRAQIRAMSGGEATLFRISGAERAFGLESPPLQSIPENVDIYSDLLERDPLTFDRIMVFYPDGSVSDNDLKITFDKQRSYRIFVHPISGTIRLVKG
jgi:general secretion pathway protein H